MVCAYLGGSTIGSFTTKIGTVRKTYCFPAMNQRESGSIQGAILLSIVCPVVDLREIKCCKRNIANKIVPIVTSFPHRTYW